MRVVDLYSRRRRVAEGDVPTVLAHDALPQELLVQIVYVWRDAIGPYSVSPAYSRSRVPHNNPAWKVINEVVAREHGVSGLAPGPNLCKRCETYLLESPSLDVTLDLIEASFRYIDRVARKFDTRERRRRGVSITADDAIGELNVRFSRAGVGYRFEAGILIRVDSEFLHTEVVRPALAFLHDKGLKVPVPNS